MQRVPALAKARGATGRRGRLQTRFDSGLPAKKNEFFDVLDATGATSGRIAGMP